MINLLPTSSVQSFQIRCAPVADYTPFKVVMHFANASTNRLFDIYPTASINSNGFLSITASFSDYLSGSAAVNEYNYQIKQISQSYSASVTSSYECFEIYRGVITATTESSMTENSIPFYSYTGSKTEYIIY